MNKTLTVPAIMASVDQVMSFVLDTAVQLSIPTEKYYGLRLAVEEFVVNSIHHGYEENQLHGELEIQVSFSNGYLSVTIIDSAPPFDPGQAAKPDDITKPYDERKIGGLGIYIALKQVDIYQYKYQDGKNINRLSFECPEEVISQLLLSQMTAVDRMNEDLSTNVHELQKQINKIQLENNTLRTMLAEKGVPALAYQAHEVDTHFQKIRGNLERVSSQMKQHQDFLRISSSIYSSLELDFVLDTVMFQVLNLTGATRALLFLRDQATDSLKIEAARTADGQHLPTTDAPYSSKIVKQVFTTKQPVLSVDAQQNDDFKEFSSVISKSVRAVICLPLMLHGTAIGVLYADSSFEKGLIDQDAIPMLAVFANQVGVAIENARSIEKYRQQARLEHELKIAEDIQRDFLPPFIPPVQGWSAESYFLPAREVAGDFYDAFLLNGRQLAFIVGDVCDKGVGAALFMALIRSLLRAYGEQDISAPDHGESTDQIAEISTIMKNVIMKTNNYIAVNHGRSNMFATIFFGVIEPDSGTIIYINAGHNQPLVLDGNGIAKHRLETTGPAVGMLPDMPFRTGYVQLEADDFIICYTDGLTEAKDKNGDFFTEERLSKLFEGQPPSSAKDAVARIRTRVKSHIASAPQFDDITLLVLQHINETIE